MRLDRDVVQRVRTVVEVPALLVYANFLFATNFSTRTNWRDVREYQVKARVADLLKRPEESARYTRLVEIARYTIKSQEKK